MNAFKIASNVGLVIALAGLGSFGVFLFLFGLLFRWLMLKKANQYATN